MHAPGMRDFLHQMEGHEGCWPWPKYCNKDGYGLTKLDGKTSIATRVAYLLEVGPIGTGMNVCHRCDNPRCVNPAHLFLGTQKDNCQDAKSKDRHSRGERNGVAKLNEDAVRSIRRSRRTQVELGQIYGVRQTVISNVILRKSWSHVQD